MRAITHHSLFLQSKIQRASAKSRALGILGLLIKHRTQSRRTAKVFSAGFLCAIQRVTAEYESALKKGWYAELRGLEIVRKGRVRRNSYDLNSIAGGAFAKVS